MKMFANNKVFFCYKVFVFCFWGEGGGGGDRIKSVKSTKTYYVIRFSFFSLNDIESKFLYIDVVKLFCTDFFVWITILLLQVSLF